jgi:hypothetical protein
MLRLLRETAALLAGFAFAAAVFTVVAAVSVVDDDVNLRVSAAAVICAAAGSPPHGPCSDSSG